MRIRALSFGPKTTVLDCVGFPRVLFVGEFDGANTTCHSLGWKAHDSNIKPCILGVQKKT